MEIKASDRTYIRDAKGTMRVADYNANGVENSDIYAGEEIIEGVAGLVMGSDSDRDTKLDALQILGHVRGHLKARRPSGTKSTAEVSSPEPRQ